MLLFSLLLFYLFSYLFIYFKLPFLNNSSKFQLPNLIYNFKNSNIHVHLFNYYFRYYYYYILFIYLFIFFKKILSLNNFSKFRFPNLISNFHVCYLIFSPVSIDFLINFHICLTLFSRYLFLGTQRDAMVFTVPS